MINREELIEVGIYNKPHGINGEISATFDYDTDAISPLECYISEINGIFVPFFTESKRAKTGSTLLVKLEGIDSEKDAKMLVNRHIYALKKDFKYSNNNELPDDDELPLDFFIGYDIISDTGNTLGTITDVDCSTENYLFIVDYDNRQVFIPATEDFITDIDINNKTIIMCLPEGILEI